MLVKDLSSSKDIYFEKKIVANCLTFQKPKLKLELKWNFDILKLNISEWKKIQVTLDISKIQCKSTGGMSASYYRAGQV